MLRNKILCDLESLDKINQLYPWIPNSSTIRPSPEDLNKKKIFSSQILNEYKSYYDFILNTVFKANYSINQDGKKYIDPNDLINCSNNKWVFEPSMFRYNLEANSNHWILWNIDNDFTFNYSDEIINNIICDFLSELSNEFEFAWYKNPKPTIPEFFHVQVFWIDHFALTKI